MNDKINDKETFVSRFGVLFLIVLAVFSIAFCILLCFANREFRHSQDDIKQTYAKHIQKADSLYMDMIGYNKNYITIISDYQLLGLLDSISLSISSNIKHTQAETKYQSLLSNRIDAVQQLHKEYDKKLQHDSLILILERQLLEGQTNSMLDAHLDKIEHEYSNITLWAAVLTILFLVFSFYSIFKMDELVQQGRIGLRDIKKLKETGDEEIKTITVQGKKQLQDAKSKLKSFVNGQQKIVAETVKKTNEDNLQRDVDYERNVLTKVEMLNKYLARIQEFMVENGIQLQENDSKEGSNG